MGRGVCRHSIRNSTASKPVGWSSAGVPIVFARVTSPPNVGHHDAPRLWDARELPSILDGWQPAALCVDLGSASSGVARLKTLAAVRKQFRDALE